ncbi:MAG: hypothetical protein JNJ57_10985 [Saprospiraceae bacterium]|nr:hypothetical protein [Saprospiraceae bacterium]
MSSKKVIKEEFIKHGIQAFWAIVTGVLLVIIYYNLGISSSGEPIQNKDKPEVDNNTNSTPRPSQKEAVPTQTQTPLELKIYGCEQNIVADVIKSVALNQKINGRLQVTFGHTGTLEPQGDGTQIFSGGFITINVNRKQCQTFDTKDFWIKGGLLGRKVEIEEVINNEICNILLKNIDTFKSKLALCSS